MVLSGGYVLTRSSGFVSAPGCICACGKDFFKVALGSCYGVVYESDVCGSCARGFGYSSADSGSRYHRLGYQWATSLLGFIALACCAIPYLFYYKGAQIRKNAKYAYSPAFESGVGDVEKGV